jgi:GAF domain-containing protein
MDTVAADISPGDSALLDVTAAGFRLQAALEDAEAAFLKTAARLRRNGQVERARRIDRYAASARFDLDEPAIAKQLYITMASLRQIGRLEILTDLALEKMLSLARANRGNIQLADPASGALRIIAHHGFDEEFLDYFAVVTDSLSACGRAAARNAQVVISDVITDRRFEPHRRIAAASAFRAVQSTPLVDKKGQLVGVVSTHYPDPYAPSARDLRIIRRYADLLGQLLSARRSLETSMNLTAVASQARISRARDLRSSGVL